MHGWIWKAWLGALQAARGKKERVPLLDGQRSGEKLNILSGIFVPAFVRKCSPEVA